MSQITRKKEKKNDCNIELINGQKEQKKNLSGTFQGWMNLFENDRGLLDFTCQYEGF